MSSRSPEEIKRDFVSAIRGLDDLDPIELLHEIIDDVLDSVQLALDSEPVATDVVQTAKDYVGNHYSEGWEA